MIWLPAFGRVMKDFIELVRVISWPVVAAAALFYGPLAEFLKELAKRATKVSAFRFEVEFPALAEAQLTPLTAEIRELRPAKEFSSSVMALLDQLRVEGPMDYAVIDLGDGTKWLTSRLFIFAVLLQRLRELRCLVFVATTSKDLPRRFVGTATPDKVRWALSQQFPWPERAFAKAYQETVESLPEPQAFIRSTPGALDSWPTTQLIQHFLEHIQSKEFHSGWIAMSQSGLWEQADWIDRACLESHFGDVLRRSWVTASADRSRSDVVQSILRCNDQFVALLEPSERFVSLVDQRSIVEQMVAPE